MAGFKPLHILCYLLLLLLPLLPPFILSMFAVLLPLQLIRVNCATILTHHRAVEEEWLVLSFILLQTLRLLLLLILLLGLLLLLPLLLLHLSTLLRIVVIALGLVLLALNQFLVRTTCPIMDARDGSCCFHYHLFHHLLCFPFSLI